MITPEEGNGSSEEILLIAEKQFDRMLRRVEEIISTLDEENTEASKAAAGCVRDLSKAMHTAFGERANLEKLRKHNAGIVHDYALDFDSARNEIGRRMARLRDAGDSGDVSE